METKSEKVPLLAAGNEEAWAEINREEAEWARARNMAMTPAERLREGQELSRVAVSLLVASIEAGHVSSRAFWS